MRNTLIAAAFTLSLGACASTDYKSKLADVESAYGIAATGIVQYRSWQECSATVHFPCWNRATLLELQKLDRVAYAAILVARKDGAQIAAAVNAVAELTDGVNTTKVGVK